MTRNHFSVLVRGNLFALAAIALCPNSFAQGPDVEAPTPAVERAAWFTAKSPSAIPEHNFWDAPNRTLFLAAAAANGADFAVTRANLQSGGQELNPIVRIFGRSTAGLALNFVSETAGLLSVNYFFHKTGHHRLERAASALNISASIGAVTFGLTHR
jgi:hypothetical protein